MNSTPWVGHRADCGVEAAFTGERAGHTQHRDNDKRTTGEHRRRERQIINWGVVVQACEGAPVGRGGRGVGVEDFEETRADPGC